jgi:hypothetical protein
MNKRILALCAIASVLALSLLVTACDKDEVIEESLEPTGENVLREGTFLVDTLKVSAIGANTVRIQKEGSETYEVGHIIIVPQVNGSEFSVLRKVTAVADDGEANLYTTTDASLNEVFKELHIHAVYDESEEFNDDLTARKEQNTANKEGETKMTFNLPDLSFGSGGTTIAGKIQLNLKKLVFDYDLNPDSRMPKWILLKATLDTDESEITFSNKESKLTLLKKLEKKYRLKPFFFPIPTPLGIIRIPLQQSLTIYYRELTVEAKFSVEFRPRFEIVAGVEYTTKDGFKDLCSVVLENDVSDLKAALHRPNATATGSLTIIEPVYEIGPMFTETSLSVNLPLRVELEIQAAKPNWKVEFTGEVEGNFNSAFFADEQTKILTISHRETILGDSGSFVFAPHKITKQGTYVEKININKPQQLYVLVSHNSGEHLFDKTVKWLVTEGKGTLSAPTTKTNLLGGVAQVTFIPTEAGKVKVTATVDPLLPGTTVLDSPLTFSFEAVEDLPNNYIRLTSTGQVFAIPDGGVCWSMTDDPENDNPGDFGYDTGLDSDTKYIVTYFSDNGGVVPNEGPYSAGLYNYFTGTTISFAHPDFAGPVLGAEMEMAGSFTVKRTSPDLTTIEFTGVAMYCTQSGDPEEEPECTAYGQVTGRMIVPCSK